MFGPLDDSLVRDADGLGRGVRGASQQIDGFGFEHALLNHSSACCATIVRRKLPSCRSMVTYKDRLAAALKAAQVSDNQLAKHLDVSIQAVRKVAAGTTSAFTAENNAKAAKFLRISPDWLATGDGEMIPDRVWPFVVLTPKEVASLTKANLETIEKLAQHLLATQTTLITSDPSYSNNTSPSRQVQPVPRKSIPVKRVAFKTPSEEDSGTGSKSEGVRSRKGRGA